MLLVQAVGQGYEKLGQGSFRPESMSVANAAMCSEKNVL